MLPDSERRWIFNEFYETLILKHVSRQQVWYKVPLVANVLPLLVSNCGVFNETVRAALSSFVSRIRDTDHSSDYTIPDGPLPTSPNQVIWQNAFWALAAIAVNTCLQDCGRVCELPKKFTLLLRSSPVYCLLDSLVVMFQLCYYSMTQGPRRAIQIISSCREQHLIHLAEGNTKPVLYIVHGLLLVMAVLQAIKLFAMRGILWTQLFGACYLLSYVVNGAINIFGDAPSDLSREIQQLPPREDVRPSIFIIHWIAILAYTLQIVIWTVALAPAVPDRLTSAPESPVDWCLFPFHLLTAIVWSPLWIGWTILFLLAPLMADIIISLIPVALGRLVLWMEPIKDVLSLASKLGLLFAADPDTIAVVCNIAIFVGFLMLRICTLQFWVVAHFCNVDTFSASIEWMTDTAFVKIDPYLVLLTSISLVAFLSYAIARLLMFGVLAKPLRLDQHMFASNLGWSCLFLFGANVVLAILFYSKTFDPLHTSKPKWVENLPRALQ